MSERSRRESRSSAEPNPAPSPQLQRETRPRWWIYGVGKVLCTSDWVKASAFQLTHLTR